MPRRLPSITSRPDHSIEDLRALGEVVRNARAHAQMRIDDAAAFATVSTDTLSRLENGRPVTTDRLLAVLEGLGLSLLIVPKSSAMRVQDALRQEQS